MAGTTMLVTLTLFQTGHPTVGVYLSFVGKIFNIGAVCVQRTFIAQLLLGFSYSLSFFLGNLNF